MARYNDRIQKPGNLLPVWCTASRAEVPEYSPSLTDKVAVESKKGLDNAVKELLKILLAPEGSYSFNCTRHLD